MMFFSERNRLANEYEEWLEQNTDVKDCALNVISFLTMKGCFESTEKDQRIAELERRLENAIVPKFKIGQKVYIADIYDGRVTKEEYIGENLEYIITFKKYHCGCCEDEYHEIEKELCFATEEEAEQKLKQLKGENNE